MLIISKSLSKQEMTVQNIFLITYAFCCPWKIWFRLGSYFFKHFQALQIFPIQFGTQKLFLISFCSTAIQIENKGTKHTGFLVNWYPGDKSNKKSTNQVQEAKNRTLWAAESNQMICVYTDSGNLTHHQSQPVNSMTIGQILEIRFRPQHLYARSFTP